MSNLLDVTIDKLEAWQAAMIAFVPPPAGALPAHRLGVHLIADLYRQSDLDYMAALRPPVIKIVNPSRDRVVEAFARIDPNGHVALRYHPISEQQAELAANPVALGVAHAQYWINQLDSTYREFDRSRLYVMGINEPNVHNAGEATTVARYTESFLKTLQPHNIRAHVFNLSVGWPREEQGNIIWSEFIYLENLINATRSFGCVHEYWYPQVTSGWNSYGNRISRCPLKIPFIIGECGYTRQLAQLPQPWGWDGNITPQTYATQLWEYADKVDPGKVFAVLPFTTSFGGEEWRSKDTAKAHADILGRKHNFVWPAGWPVYGGVTPPPPIDTSDKNLLIVPAYAGKVTGWYGSLYTNSGGVTYPHEGLDVSAPAGTPIYAAYDGVVAWADPTQGEKSPYGIYARIYHPELQTCFFYGHLSRCDVKTGNSIKQGQLIGLSGNTGNSTGAHIHFEVRAMTPSGGYVTPSGVHGNGRVDPIAFLHAWTATGRKIEYR